MRACLKREILAVILLKVIGLTLLWFFFVKNHEVEYGALKTGQHIIDNISRNK